jgi:hypothetical protein
VDAGTYIERSHFYWCRLRLGDITHRHLALVKRSGQPAVFLDLHDPHQTPAQGLRQDARFVYGLMRRFGQGLIASGLIFSKRKRNAIYVIRTANSEERAPTWNLAWLLARIHVC